MSSTSNSTTAAVARDDNNTAEPARTEVSPVEGAAPNQAVEKLEMFKLFEIPKEAYNDFVILLDAPVNIFDNFQQDQEIEVVIGNLPALEEVDTTTAER